MTKDEALKLGLQVVEAAEYLANNPAIFGEYVQEKRALKRALIQRSKIAFEEALAQPEQEPVAWANLNELSEQIKRVNCGTVYGQPPELIRFGWQSVYEQPPEAEGSQPLYTTPPQRKPLMDWEISNVYFDATGQGLRLQDKALAHKFARAIEAAHGIKE